MAAFTVFVDEPVSAQSSSPANNTSQTPATTSEKENLHPVTGEQAILLAEAAQVKKQKTAILSTKSYVPPSRKNKKVKELALVGRDTQGNQKPEQQKRSALTASDNKAVVKKPRCNPEPGRTHSGPRQRKARPTCMPKVVEEVEETQLAPHVVESIITLNNSNKTSTASMESQADIDSKCYALTVTPLADVSHAFERLSLLTSSSPELAIAECSSESLSEDNAQKASAANTPAKTGAHTTTNQDTLANNNGKLNGFSTPERKLIYSAFTFASPSPSSQRFAAARAGGGLNTSQFGDVRLTFSF